MYCLICELLLIAHVHFLIFLVWKTLSLQPISFWFWTYATWRIRSRLGNLPEDKESAWKDLVCRLHHLWNLAEAHLVCQNKESHQPVLMAIMIRVGRGLGQICFSQVVILPCIQHIHLSTKLVLIANRNQSFRQANKDLTFAVNSFRMCGLSYMFLKR